jgi:hypothetical protein
MAYAYSGARVIGRAIKTAPISTQNVMRNLEMINFKTNNSVLYSGILSVLFYFGVVAVISLIIDPVLIMFTFYFPGFIFGIFLSRGLNENINKQALIVILSTIEFLCALLFTSKDWDYIELRRLIFGGLFAVIFLGTIDLIYSKPNNKKEKEAYNIMLVQLQADVGKASVAH